MWMREALCGRRRRLRVREDAGVREDQDGERGEMWMRKEKIEGAGKIR
jgi:hypothetical protein